MDDIPGAVTDAIGKKIGPFKGWQWVLVAGVPIGLWIFLSRKNTAKPADSSAGSPQPVGADNSVYTPEGMAILGRLNELSNSVNNSNPNGNGIPMANLSLIAANLERAADLTKFAANSAQLNSWASQLYDMIGGRSDYNQGLVDQIVSYFKAAGIPTDTLYSETNPTTDPPNNNPPPTNNPPANNPPANNYSLLTEDDYNSGVMAFRLRNDSIAPNAAQSVQIRSYWASANAFIAARSNDYKSGKKWFLDNCYNLGATAKLNRTNA